MPVGLRLSLIWPLWMVSARRDKLLRPPLSSWSQCHPWSSWLLRRNSVCGTCPMIIRKAVTVDGVSLIYWVCLSCVEIAGFGNWLHTNDQLGLMFSYYLSYSRTKALSPACTSCRSSFNTRFSCRFRSNVCVLISGCPARVWGGCEA